MVKNKALELKQMVYARKNKHREFALGALARVRDHFNPALRRALNVFLCGFHRRIPSTEGLSPIIIQHLRSHLK